MLQPQSSTKCSNDYARRVNDILQNNSKYNIAPAIKRDKELHQFILDKTSHFPSNRSLSFRAYAVTGVDVKCKHCGEIVKHIGKEFCCRKCNHSYRRDNPEDDSVETILDRMSRMASVDETPEINDQFVSAWNKIRSTYDSNTRYQVLGFLIKIAKWNKDVSDYYAQAIRCQEHPKKSENMEWLTLLYGEEKAKEHIQKKSERVRGENNPGYQHGGKFSVWSENFVNGYDKERHDQFKKESSERLQSFEYRVNNPFFLEYWIEQCDGDEEQAKNLHSQSQTRDLKWFTDKFGEEEGKRRHAAKTDKWMATFASKPEEELERIAQAKLRTRGGAASPYETEVKEFLEETGYSVTTQMSLPRDDDPKRKFYYDIIVGNKIIEVHGDYYHANPNKFAADHLFRGKITAKQIWEKDAYKKQIAINNGYDFHHIWASDLQSNKEQVIRECLNFLNQ